VKVYIAHPYSDDVAANVERVRAICRNVVAEGHLPIAPQLYLPAFVDEDTDRELALKLCLELVTGCDALWLYGTRISPGMEREISVAQERRIPVVNRLYRASRCRPLAFVDVETTGLDPQVHALIEVAVLKVDADILAVIDRFESRVRPAPDAVVDPAAARVNGYAPEDWSDAPDLQDVLPRVAAILGGSIIAGHNPGFDWAFLSAAFRRADSPLPDVDHHLLDTASLAWPLLRKGAIPSLSLRDLCAHLKVTNDGAHRAMADAERAFHVYRHLMEAKP
jgi:DNA polymerase-3 subunit epsilon